MYGLSKCKNIDKGVFIMRKKFSHPYITVIIVLIILSILTVSCISFQNHTNVSCKLIYELNRNVIQADIPDNECILINDTEHLNNILSGEYKLNFDFENNTYMFSVGKEIKSVKKRQKLKIPPITHFVFVEQMPDFSHDKIYVYEINEKVYFDERRNDNIHII